MKVPLKTVMEKRDGNVSHKNGYVGTREVVHITTCSQLAFVRIYGQENKNENHASQGA